MSAIGEEGTHTFVAIRKAVGEYNPKTPVAHWEWREKVLIFVSEPLPNLVAYLALDPTVEPTCDDADQAAARNFNARMLLLLLVGKTVAIDVGNPDVFKTAQMILHYLDRRYGREDRPLLSREKDRILRITAAVSEASLDRINHEITAYDRRVLHTTPVRYDELLGGANRLETLSRILGNTYFRGQVKELQEEAETALAAHLSSLPSGSVKMTDKENYNWHEIYFNFTTDRYEMLRELIIDL